MQTRIFRIAFFGLVFVILLLAPGFVHAASIYFAPAEGSYEVGKQFSVDVFVSSKEQEMNAIEAITAPINNNLELVSVSKSGSIIDFWAVEPRINGNKSIYFEGVMLGRGYFGSAGKIATIVLRARSTGEVALSFTSGGIFANDGQGTALPTSLGTARFTISSQTIPEPPVILAVPETIPEGFSFVKSLRQGNTSAEVSYLQICLKEQGFYTDKITGYFSAQTKQAVIEFQEFYHEEILAPWGFEQGTGLVQKTTLEKLNAVCFVTQVVEDIEQLYATTTPVPAPIEITEEEKDAFYTNIWFWVGMTAVLAMVIILLLIIIIVLLLRRAPNYFERKHKQVLAKEETTLRKASKHLLTTKKKIEQELQKIEDKLKKFSKEDGS